MGPRANFRWNRIAKKLFFVLFAGILKFFLKTEFQIVTAQQENKVQFQFLQKQSESCGQIVSSAARGQIPRDVRTLVPWTAAVFRRVSQGNKWEFYSSGTVVGSGLVTSLQAGPLGRFPGDKNPDNFFVVTGVNSTNFSEHDQRAQYSRVSFIQPYDSKIEQNEYAHGVIYHLTSPLDLSTPFVREICWPFFVVNLNNRFASGLYDALKSVRFDFFQFGFATQAAPTTRGQPGQVKKERHWVLKAWKVRTLPEASCNSVFRFYYRRPEFPLVCSVRSGTTDGVTNDSDEHFCQGSGSGGSFNVGNTWYFLGASSLVPSRRKRRCNSKTVYIRSYQNLEALAQVVQSFINTVKCGANRLSCDGDGKRKSEVKCIPVNQTCDGVFDCLDESDELAGLCSWKNGSTSPISSKARKGQRSPGNGGYELEGKSIINRCPNLDKIPIPPFGARCTNLNTNDLVDCNNSEFYPGARIRVTCDEFHRTPKAGFEFMDLVCESDGEWTVSGAISCEKDCGIYPENKFGTFYTGLPWDVAIFEGTTKICSGTLLEPNFVVTHAACLKSWLEFKGVERDNDNLFLVVSRPVSSNLRENLESNFTQNARIKGAWISVNSLTPNSDDPINYSSGIALVQLTTGILTHGRNLPIPACYLVPPFVNFTRGLRAVMSTGILTGEQRTDSTAEANVTVVSNEECTNARVFQNDRSLIEKNEFCGTFDPGLSCYPAKSTIQGAGVVVPQKGPKTGSSKNQHHHVLVGILSSVGDDDRGVFMSLNYFSEWMLDILETSS